MVDSYRPIPDETIDHIDDAGQIHMQWDNGFSFALIPEADVFEIIDVHEDTRIRNRSDVNYEKCRNKIKISRFTRKSIKSYFS